MTLSPPSPPLTNEENKRLVAEYQAAKSAGDTLLERRISERLVVGNEGLVRKFVARYARPQNEEDKEDALQAGRMGVLRAARDYDPEKGAFSTHAHNHIRDYVQRWTGKTVSVTRPRTSTMPGRIAAMAQRYRQLHGKEPTAQDLGVTEEKLSDWSRGVYFYDVDHSNEQEDGHTTAIQLTYEGDPKEEAERRLRMEESWDVALSEMSPRNQEIAKRLFVLGEYDREVAKHYGLARSRVAQLRSRIEWRIRRYVDPEVFEQDPELRRRLLQARRERAAR